MYNIIYCMLALHLLLGPKDIHGTKDRMSASVRSGIYMLDTETGAGSGLNFTVLSHRKAYVWMEYIDSLVQHRTQHSIVSMVTVMKALSRSYQCLTPVNYSAPEVLLSAPCHRLHITAVDTTCHIQWIVTVQSLSLIHI